MNSARFQDFLKLGLGVWLVASPFWLPGYESLHTVAAVNALIVGALIVIVAVATFFAPRDRGEHIEAMLGLWLVATTYLLNFHRSVPAAGLNQLTVGMFVIV